MENVYKWCNYWKLIISPEKCSIADLSKKKLQSIPRITYAGFPLPWKQTIKYLGINFSKANQNGVILKTIRSKALRKINALKSIAYKKYGPRTKDLINIVNNSICCLFYYSCSLTNKFSETQYKACNSIQTMALRVALGLPKWTPNIVLMKIAGQEVLSEKIKRYKDAHCAVYSGDCVPATDIITNVEVRFNIKLLRNIDIVYLRTHFLVEAKYYPIFTLLMQSLRSVVLGLEALLKYAPDIYIDSMGYAWTFPVFTFLGSSPVAAYVHYPTISTDMLKNVQTRTTAVNNRGYISKSKIFSQCKLVYYQIFVSWYGLVGRQADVIMVNSSWTRNHILELWKKPQLTLLFIRHVMCLNLIAFHWKYVMVKQELCLLLNFVQKKTTSFKLKHSIIFLKD
ncbi:GDP-Man:Man(3)GlcNAc(2)-PP-Dol alpha-1,2-mannosyltransferase [Araneus ventricosus]|uniref:GDP-Man:Man(3)GlcNAc(2)-PP-Dol alpha-1,2-mannosyltransferase n=1 Tax=Araneus ventricosus TaxID=182803 RepID=A0A4Y2FIS1_ARAVE|nr:GDP-Man:Man(3)GlcNAc(2)-PP-Dol alpha-1,2-mannosyltransferase [Araneus ventricosus]